MTVTDRDIKALGWLWKRGPMTADDLRVLAYEGLKTCRNRIPVLKASGFVEAFGYPESLHATEAGAMLAAQSKGEPLVSWEPVVVMGADHRGLLDKLIAERGWVRNDKGKWVKP